MEGQVTPTSASSWRSVPVTAVCRLHDTGLVLTGQGGRAHLYNLQSASDAPVASIDLLASASVHGFVELCCSPSRRVLVCWGANFIRIFEVSGEDESHAWVLTTLGALVKATDWILSVCEVPEHGLDRGTKRIALLDAHNQVQLLACNVDRHEVALSRGLDHCPERRQVMLYHGHICMVDGRLAVASGTMFGQVLFEAYSMSSSGKMGTTVARDVFHDHEGSVFGVQVLGRRVTARGQAHYRLASCSDDRTVRVYEIPDDTLADAHVQDTSTRTGFVDFLDLPTATPTANTGHAMGHESRIWSVVWLDSDEISSTLITFGEDSTAQTWVVKHAREPLSSAFSSPSTTVTNANTYGFHTGKNIWAASVVGQGDGVFHVCTGGADGRVVSYHVLTQDCKSSKAGHVLRQTISQDQILPLGQDQEATESDNNADDAERVFSSLAGRWKLQRSIVSQRADYPSGDFEGEATLTQRSITNDAYDSELLYEEKGQLVLANGLNFPARRNYVYRYQRSSDTITAWFVKPDEPTTVDYLFHQVEFKDSVRRRKAQDNGLELAEGYHLCVADHYNASYEFVPGERGLDRWSLAYHVKGPQKDYVAKSSFLPVDDGKAGPPVPTEHIPALEQNYTKADSYRSYTWLNSKKCLATTEQGRVLLILVNESSGTDDARPHVEMIQLTQLPQLASHPLTCTLSRSSALIAAGSGDLFHYSDRTQSVNLIHSFATKVISLIPIGDAAQSGTYSPFVVKCLKEATIRVLYISKDGEKVAEAELEVSRGFLAMSAAYLNDRKILAIGSRVDGLSMWQIHDEAGSLTNNAVTYCQNVRLHGANAITAIVQLPPSNGSSSNSTPRENPASSQASAPVLFATTGRDGMVKIHKLQTQDSTLETIHALRWAYGPDLVGISLGSAFILWGFDRTDFVVVDATQNTELMRVPCGNAHRNWAFHRTPDSTTGFEGLLVWTQANACHFHLQSQPSHTVLASGGHGREIKAVSTFRDRQSQVVATGAEDTDIKLFEAATVPTDLNSTVPRAPLRCIATLPKHQAGLTHLSFVAGPDPATTTLLSAAGNEELFAWTLERLPPPLHLAVRLRAACPKVHAGLLRITDVCPLEPGPGLLQTEPGYELVVAVAYSDASLRLWAYTAAASPPAFRLLAAGVHGQNCLTCVRALEPAGARDVDSAGRPHPALLTAGTDGSLVVWSITTPEPEAGASTGASAASAHPPPQLSPRQKIAAHASAIKALYLAPLPLAHGSFIVVSGGDDGAVVITLLDGWDSASGGYAVRQTLIPRAHAAAVNAVELVSEQVGEGDGNFGVEMATTGSDQRVVVWRIDVGADSADGVEVRREVGRTAVGDASGVVKIEGGLLVVGVGMEMVGLGEGGGD